MTRRDLLSSVLVLVLPGRASAQADLPAEGTYVGRWTGGQTLRQTVRVLSPDLLTVRRLGAGAPPVSFERVGPGAYRNAAGHTLLVEGPTRLRWQGNGASVSYARE